MTPLKILHIENTAGVAAMIAKGERALGHESDVLETWRSASGYPHDIEHYYDGSMPHILREMSRTVRDAKRYDIIHAHSGLARRRVDYTIIKRVYGKPLVVHYHGSDCRMGYGNHHRSLPDARIVATPDLLSFHPNAEFIPNPMEPMGAAWPDGRFKIIHMPTNRVKKGTEAVLRACEALNYKGFDLVLIENRTHDEALAALSRAHVLVDQVNRTLDGHPAGLIGVASLEGMAMGKAVIGSMSLDGYGRYYPQGYPGIYADEETLRSVLETLVSEPEKARRAGEAGQRWIGENLRPEIIAKRHIAVYRRVLDGVSA